MPLTPQPAKLKDPRNDRLSKVLHLMALVLTRGPECPVSMGSFYRRERQRHPQLSHCGQLLVMFSPAWTSFGWIPSRDPPRIRSEAHGREMSLGFEAACGRGSVQNHLAWWRKVRSMHFMGGDGRSGSARQHHDASCGLFYFEFSDLSRSLIVRSTVSTNDPNKIPMHTPSSPPSIVPTIAAECGER